MMMVCLRVIDCYEDTCVRRCSVVSACMIFCRPRAFLWCVLRFTILCYPYSIVQLFIDDLLKLIGSFFAITGVFRLFYTVVSAMLVVHNLTLEEGATGEICVNLTQPPDSSITVIVTSVDGLAQSTTYLC